MASLPISTPVVHYVQSALAAPLIFGNFDQYSVSCWDGINVPNLYSKKERINSMRKDRKIFKNEIRILKNKLVQFIKDNGDEYLIISEEEILEKLEFNKWHLFHSIKDFNEQLQNVFIKISNKNKNIFYATEIVENHFNEKHHEYRIYKSYVSQEKGYYKEESVYIERLNDSFKNGPYTNGENFLILNDDKNLSMTKLLKY